MIDLKNKIREIIEEETQKGHFTVLDKNSVELIQQIFDGYEKEYDLKQDFNDVPKKADLIFIAAPTGAGKDGLVSRINHDNPDKNYIELNMDIFRYYFEYFISDLEKLRDKTFANETNEFSYELYYTVQEVLLSEFPGTNIIITGTLWKTDWVEETFEKYKSNKFTDYNITLASLAVPAKDSAFSIIKRYVLIIDDKIEKKEDTGKLIYSQDFVPGSARYTTIEYHNETFKRFPENLEYFQKMFQEGRLIDDMKVYKRAEKEFDYSENTLVYSSDNPENKTALDVVNELRNSKSQITPKDVISLFDVIKDSKNSTYLKNQDVLLEIIHDLADLLDKSEMLEKRMKLDSQINIENNYTKEDDSRESLV